VRGIRHVTGAAEAIEDLSPGELLRLVDDRENPYNPQALLLHRDDELPVGYVPDYLVDHVHDLRHLNGHDPDVIVEHVNDADTAPRLRILCRIDARQPYAYRTFPDARFQPRVPRD